MNETKEQLERFYDKYMNKLGDLERMLNSMAEHYKICMEKNGLILTLNYLKSMSKRDRDFFISQELSGNCYKDLRQKIMLELTGNKLPKAKCGIYAITEALEVIIEKEGKK